MKIAILGSGLSGLLTTRALALSMNKIDFDIFTKKKDKPEPKGFMMLHDNCGLGLEKKGFIVKQLGKEEHYKRKLGYNKDVSSSWKSGLDEYWMVGHNPYQAIDMLWDWYENRIFEHEITPENFKEIKKDYDYIISTIPPTCWCDKFELEQTEIWIKTMQFNSRHHNPHVIYMGNSSGEPIRLTKQLWDYNVYKEYSKKPVGKSTKVIKPIKIKNFELLKEIDFFNDKIIMAGRKGVWNKNILAHQVYYQIKNLIDIKGW